MCKNRDENAEEYAGVSAGCAVSSLSMCERHDGCRSKCDERRPRSRCPYLKLRLRLGTEKTIGERLHQGLAWTLDSVESTGDVLMSVASHGLEQLESKYQLKWPYNGLVLALATITLIWLSSSLCTRVLISRRVPIIVELLGQCAPNSADASRGGRDQAGTHIS